MKHSITILSLLVTQTLFGQNSIDTISVLNLYQKANYKEANKFWLDSNDSGIILYHEVIFNDPNVIDDEYAQMLFISISDSAIAAGQRFFDLINDSVLLKYNYEKISPWNWPKRNVTFVGYLKIISLTKNKIKTVFDLKVIEKGKRIYAYQGKRLFKKSKPLIKSSIDLK